MATRTRARAGRAARRGGGGRSISGRRGGGRSTLARRGGGRSTPGGAAGLVSRVTGMLGRGGGARGRRRGTGGAGAGLANRATNFVRGFMSGGGSTRRGRGRHR
jgi:hypothetical protein